MVETFNLTDFIFHGAGILVLKIPLLILILIFTLFLFIVMKRIKALNRTITVHTKDASDTLQTVALVQFILAILLFFLTIFVV